MTAVKQLAEEEHFATLAQLRSRVSAIMKFGAGADNDLCEGEGFDHGLDQVTGGRVA